MAVSKNMVSASDLEREIFEKEEIRVVIRAPKDKKFQSYEYQRKTATTTSVTDWYNQRLKPILGNDDADVIDGHGNVPHGRTNMETIRKSYT